MWIDLLIRVLVFLVVCAVVYYIVTFIAAKAAFDAAVTKIILYVLGAVALIWLLVNVVKPLL